MRLIKSNCTRHPERSTELTPKSHVEGLLQDLKAFWVKPRSRFSSGRGDWSCEFYDFLDSLIALKESITAFSKFTRRR